MTLRLRSVAVIALALATLTMASCAKQEAPPAAGASTGPNASYAAELARVEANTDRALGTATESNAGPAEAASVQKQATAELSPSERRALLQEAERVFSSSNAPSSVAVTLLRQDLAERSARVALSLGEREEALRWVERGLSLERAPSLVVVNLLVGRADVLEALGRPDEARSSLVQALGVNQALLAQELDE